MVLALAYALTWYNGDVAEWMRIAQVIGLCVVGAVAYAMDDIVARIEQQSIYIHQLKTAPQFAMIPAPAREIILRNAEGQLVSLTERLNAAVEPRSDVAK